MHECALAPSQKTWLLHTFFFFFRVSGFFWHLLNLQSNGEAYHIETAVKPYLNNTEIKTFDLC